MIHVLDNFCPQIETVRASALASGFGTWKPNQGYVGSSNYEGMNFWGEHSYMLSALSFALQSIVYPNAMFFRYTTPHMEKAYIHSDRTSGAFTCICYLSDHDESYGTAFYQHESGLLEMPPFHELNPELIDDMVKAKGFEQIEFVPGKKNRAVIFSAPLFHSRFPLEGIGEEPETARMVWACHFHTPESLESHNG